MNIIATFLASLVVAGTAVAAPAVAGIGDQPDQAPWMKRTCTTDSGLRNCVVTDYNGRSTLYSVQRKLLNADGYKVGRVICSFNAGIEDPRSQDSCRIIARSEVHPSRIAIGDYLVVR